MITPNEILEPVKKYLGLTGTTEYDDVLVSVHIPSAISMINVAGVPTPSDTNVEYIQQYITSVSLQCFLGLDFNIDYARIRAMYDSNVLALREKYKDVQE